MNNFFVNVTNANKVTLSGEGGNDNVNAQEDSTIHKLVTIGDLAGTSSTIDLTS